MTRRLLDAKAIQEEYGFSKDTAYELMRKAGAINLAKHGIRKLYVRQADLDRLLDEARTR